MIETIKDLHGIILCYKKWTDHLDVEHIVRDDYERNRILIDLTLQPDEIKTSM